MNKKILFAISASTGLFLLAGQALAMAYAPGTNVNGIMNEAQSAATITKNPVGGQVWQYDTQAGNNNLGYRITQAQPLGGPVVSIFGNRGVVWFGFMFIITVVLVWIVLIQLIFVLKYWLKKHKN